MKSVFQGRNLFVRLCLILACAALVGIGLATIYAVGHPAEPSPGSRAQELAGFFKKQLMFVAIGLIGFVGVNLVSYRKWGEVSYVLFFLILLLLTWLVASKYCGGLPFAPVLNHAYRWIVFHPKLPAIQPSEFCKLVYVITLAWYLRFSKNYRNISVLIGPFILTLIPMALIILEPDLGTVLLLMPVLLAMLFAAGAHGKHILLIMLMGVMFSPVLWMNMKGYQRERVSCVLLQNSWVRQKAVDDPNVGQLLTGKKFTQNLWFNDIGYHLIRSKYAISSGGLAGKGFRKGPFIKYDFLDYRYNDFIAASIAHQWGFLGLMGVLALYFLVILCGLEIAENNTDPFGRILAIGIVALIAFEVFVNIGMTVGLMPITGLTLPMISYGGSSMVVHMMAIGMLNNVGRSRPFLKIKD